MLIIQTTIVTNSRVEIELAEGEDYYREGALVVFTERYHLRRGYCCESGCRHCPYRVAVSREEFEREAVVDEE